MCALLEHVGIRLDDSQLDILHAATLVRADGLWAAFTVAVCAPRQNGKNEILQARELIGALILEEPLQIHSAHLADTCMESFMRWDDLIDSSDWLAARVKRISRTNGREAVHFTNGCRVRFRTRTRGGGRGFSGSPVIFDEPMFFPEISHNAILPVLSAQPNPQAWYTGSAVDQDEHPDGVVFARVRERALAGDSERLAYFEWSLDHDGPDLVPDDQASDRESWAATNWAYGIRITPEYIEAERQELSPRGFAVERLGVGDWPATDGSHDQIINLDAWNALADDLSVLQDPVCLAFDVSPDRRSSIAAAGLNQHGHIHLEVINSRAGTGWLTDRLLELQSNHEVLAVACDAFGPASSVAAKAKQAGLTLRELNAGELAQACSALIDEIEGENVRHIGQDDLNMAVRGARTRPLVDRWAWSRTKSQGDCGPLIAATMALFAADEQGFGDVAIY